MDFGIDGRDSEGLTRRDLIVRGVGAGAALALGRGVLAPSDASAAASMSRSLTSSLSAHGLSALPGGKPKRGGTFTVAALSNGTAETLFPGAAAVAADWSRQYALFEPLFYPGRYLTPLEPGLALSAESNAKATKWTFHLRPGVKWHDGKALTAEDLVWNFRSVWANPTNFANGYLAPNTDFRSARKVGPLAVEVSLLQPDAQYPAAFALYMFLLVQNGATQKSTERNPIGTGPFRYVSFIPGSHSVFKRNPDYWREGKPYVDSLVVDSSFTDQLTAFNALLSGEANLYPQVPFTTAREQLSSKQVRILESPPSSQSAGFCMRVDKGPFADNRVRTGFKLLVDRQAIIDGAFSGFGSPGNDIPGYLCRYYANDLKRTQDVERAKSLFRAAGVLGHTFTLQTSAATPGQVESATLLAQQATAAGVKVRVQTLSVSTYFVPTGGFGTRFFGQEINQPVASLPTVYDSELVTGCPYPDTHWGAGPHGAARTAAIQAATAETNPTKANEMWHAVQEAQFNQGGYIWWTNFPFVDAAADNVRGLSAGAGFNYNNWDYASGWLD